MNEHCNTFERNKIDKFEKAIIYFEELRVELENGTNLPIIKMWTKRGNAAENYNDVLMISAGAGDTWVNLRLLD